MDEQEEFLRRMEIINDMTESLGQPKKKKSYLGALNNNTFEFSLPLPVIMSAISPWCLDIQFAPMFAPPKPDAYIYGKAIINHHSFDPREVHEYISKVVSELASKAAEIVKEKQEKERMSVFENFVDSIED